MNNQEQQTTDPQTSQPVSLPVKPQFSNEQNSSSSNILKIFLSLLVLVLIIMLPLGGYQLGIKNQSDIVQTKIVKIPSSITRLSPTPILSTSWGDFQQQFDTNLAYDLQYPLDYSVSVFNGQNVGLPVSTLKLLLSHAVEFTETPLNNSQNEITIGVSNIDPSLCYTTTCQHTLESIKSISTASMSGMLVKRIQGTANPDGGVLPLGPTPSVILYVFPINGQYILLLSEGNNTNVLGEIANSLKVITY